MFLDKKKIPNLLTTFRIFLIPFVIYSFYSPYKTPNMISGFLFFIASVTDFFDGKLAREYKVQSNFGKCLDPIADKLLVCVSLIMLICFSDRKNVILIPSIIIICREIMVSGLREFLSTIKISVPVSRLAKWKTGIQMGAIGTLLYCSNGSELVYEEITNFIELNDYFKFNFEGTFQIIGEILLFISSILTIITGYIYFKIGFKNF